MQASKSSRRWATLIVVSFVLMGVAVRPTGVAQGKDDLSSVITAMNSKATKFSSLQADIEWETYLKVVDEKEVQTGKSRFRRQGNEVEAMLDIEKPNPKQLLYKGHTL
jgi:hypothetical protein